MGREVRYFWIQIKRICRIMPGLQLGFLLLILCLGAGAWMLMKNSDHEKSQSRFEVGLVGDTTSTYLGFGIQMVQSIDTSRFMVNFQMLTEEEADRALRGRKLSCYMRIPDGLVEAWVYGRNDKSIDVIISNGNGVTIHLAGELTDIVSTLLLCSQSAVFGMQRVLYTQGMAESVDGYTDKLNFRFFDVVLNRTDLCGKEMTGICKGISTEGYYLCGLLVFFLLLSGITGSSLFAGRNRELNCLMASKGVRAFAQITGEYLAYAGMNLLYMTETVLLVGVLHGTGILEIDEWKYLGMEAVIGFWCLLLLVSLMLSAFQFLIYELIPGMVSSILLQFICSIVMGYLAGCFYPYSFFRDILQRLGACLPTGAALRYVQDGFMGEVPMLARWVMAGYLLLFLELSVAVRRLRTVRGR